MNEQLTNVVLSLSSLSNKRIESLSKKVLKKMSFSSSKDLSNLEELCCWLYIYGYVIELKKFYSIIFSLSFCGNYDIWTPIECMLSLIYYITSKDKNTQNEAKIALEKIMQAETDKANIIKRCDGFLLKEFEDKVREYTILGKKTDLRNWLRYEMQELLLIYALGGSEKYPYEKIGSRVEEIKKILKEM